MADSSKNQSYSLISVEKAENRSFEDSVSAAASADFSVEVSPSEKENNTSEVKQSASSSEESALDNLTEEDLRGSAPLENMHKIILVVLILALIVFAVYFFVSM